jgi:hypothetical protein
VSIDDGNATEIRDGLFDTQYTTRRPVSEARAFITILTVHISRESVDCSIHYIKYVGMRVRREHYITSITEQD